MIRLHLFILLSLCTISAHAQPKGNALTDTTQTAYLAGSCFWGIEALVRQIPACGGADLTKRIERKLLEVI